MPMLYRHTAPAPGIRYGSLVGGVLGVALLLLMSWLVNSQPLTAVNPLTPLVRVADIILLGCLILIAHAVGTFLLERIEIPLSGVEGAAITSTLGLGIIAYLLLGLGLLGLYRAPIIAIVFLVLIITLRRYVLSAWSASFRVLRQTRQMVKRGTIGRLAIALLCLCCGALCLSFLGALTPPHHHDPLAYHLPLPQRFLQTGLVEPVPDIIGSDLPLTVELLFGIGLIWGSAPFSALLHLTFGGFTAIMVWGSARRWFDLTTAWFALALFLGTPLVFVWARVANNDLAVGCFLFAALIVALHSRPGSAQASSWRWVALSGGFIGLAFSTKYQAAPAALPLGLWFFLAAWRGGMGPVWSRQRLWQGVRALLIFGGVAVAVTLPWSLLNTTYLFALLQLLLNLALPALATGQEPSLVAYLAQGLTISPRTPLGYLLLPIRAYIRGDFEQRFVVLNPLFLLLPALVVLPRWWRNRALHLSLAMVGSFSLVWALGVQELRYLLAICPMLAIAVACILRSAWDRRILRPLIGSGLILSALLTLILTFLHVGADRPLAVTLGLESRDSYLRQSVTFGATYRATSFLTDQLVSGEQAILINEVQTYYLPEGKVVRSIEARNIMFTLVEQYSTPQEALAALQEQRVAYVLVNDADLRWWMQADTTGRVSQVRSAFNRIIAQMVQIYQDGPVDKPNITIYRVPDKMIP